VGNFVNSGEGGVGNLSLLARKRDGKLSLLARGRGGELCHFWLRDGWSLLAGGRGGEPFHFWLGGRVGNFVTSSLREGLETVKLVTSSQGRGGKLCHF